MIEDYQAKRRRSRRLSRLLLILGIILALVAGVTTYFYASFGGGGGIAPAAAQPTETVVVATRDIAPRTTIVSDDLMVVRTVKDLVPPGALTSPDAAIGRLATVPIAKGEVLLPAKFQPIEGFGFSVFPAGQQPTGSAPEFRAMSISVPDAQAVGGAIQAGDIVDIVFSLSFEPPRVRPAASSAAPAPSAAPALPAAPVAGPLTDFAAKITYERVPVLAKTLTTYSIRIEAGQAERIAAITSAGATIHLLLRAREDTRSTTATGALYSVESSNLIRAIPTR